MISIVLSTVATILVACSVILFNKSKPIYANEVGLFGCCMWIFYALSVGAYGIIPVNFIFMLIYVRGLFKAVIEKELSDMEGA